MLGSPGNVHSSQRHVTARCKNNIYQFFQFSGIYILKQVRMTEILYMGGSQKVALQSVMMFGFYQNVSMHKEICKQ